MLVLLTCKINNRLQGMFVPAIKGQGTEEQQQKWLPLAYKFQIIGCYAQTELGHGSNVQGLETTATFDPKTDEFVIHSPTLTSSKVKFYESTDYILTRF
jgi:acyl-CoA oxidase